MKHRYQNVRSIPNFARFLCFFPVVSTFGNTLPSAEHRFLYSDNCHPNLLQWLLYSECALCSIYLPQCAFAFLLESSAYSVSRVSLKACSILVSYEFLKISFSCSSAVISCSNPFATFILYVNSVIF